MCVCVDWVSHVLAACALSPVETQQPTQAISHCIHQWPRHVSLISIGVSVETVTCIHPTHTCFISFFLSFHLPLIHLSFLVSTHFFFSVSYCPFFSVFPPSLFLLSRSLSHKTCTRAKGSVPKQMRCHSTTHYPFCFEEDIPCMWGQRGSSFFIHPSAQTHTHTHSHCRIAQ